MTPLATLFSGMVIGAVGTWLYERNVTMPRLRRSATETTPSAATPTTISTETASTAPAKRRWAMPAFRRNKETPAETATPVTADSAMGEDVPAETVAA